MTHDTRSLELSFLDINNNADDVYVDRYPDECPVCNKGVEVKPLSAYGKIEDNPWREGHFIQVVFRCPKIDCQTVFFAVYTSPNSKISSGGYVFLKHTYVLPYIKTETFDPDVEKLSPNFVKIYTQAKGADDSGFDLICGPGYRKALEFLVKDFLVTTKPAKEKLIKAKMLGWLIVNEVDDPRIKTTAGLAKDVGNDETHYEKKLDELDIEDLKKLVKLTLYWIISETMTNNYASKK